MPAFSGYTRCGTGYRTVRRSARRPKAGSPDRRAPRMQCVAALLELRGHHLLSASLRVVVLPVGRLHGRLVGRVEVEEVRRPVQLVVELLGVCELELVLHVGRVAHAHEVVVPHVVLGHHEEAEELVGEQHLHALVVRGQVAVRVGARVAVLPPPLVAGGRELVGGEGDGAGREGARDDDGALAVPRLVLGHGARVRRHVDGRELRQLVGLRVHPAERLHALEVLVLGQHGGRVHHLVRAPLRHHDHAAHLLDLRVVGRRDAVEVARDLRAQVGDGDELLQQVLGQDVGVALLRAVVGGDVDVRGAQVQVGGGDGADAPVGLGGVGLLLVLRGRGDDELLAVHVGGLGGDGVELRRLARALLDLGHLLPLHRGRRDLHAEDDVADLGLRERGNVDVVLLAVVAQDEVLELHLDRDPLLVAQRGPHVVRLRRRVAVGAEHELAPLLVDVEGAQDEQQPREGRVRRDGLEPVVVDVEEDHLRLGGLEDQVAELLDLEARLEGQLQLGALDDDVGEVEQVHLERVEHALARHDDLLGLLLDGQRADERGHLLGGLPLGELPQPLLARPDGGVDDLEEELAGARVEDEDGAVDGLGRQVALEGLVDGDAVDVGVIDEPDDLVGEELAVVLRREVGLRRLGRVELQPLADALAQHVERRVGLEDLGHGLRHERLHARDVVAVGRVQVVREVEPDHEAGGRGVDGHVVRRVVEELGARVPLDVVAVVVAPAQLHVEPVLGRRAAVVRVLGLGEQRGLGDLPLVRGEEQNVGAARVHLVRLARVDGLLLHGLDLERVELLVENLAEVHHDGLVHLLPQVRAEDLDERDLERRDLAVHEDARQVELHLEAHVDVGAVDRGRPPEREAPVGDLVEAGALRVGELLVLHALLEARGLLPEQALPRGEVGALEEGVLEDALDAAERLDHVGAVVVEVPQLAVVPLVRPPEGVLPHDLELLELRAHAPALVVGQRVPVLLEEGVDARDAAVPAVLEVLERQPPVLRVGLLPLERVLGPDALRVDELALPRLDVPEEVGDHLVLLVAHAAAEVRDARVGLLGEAQVGLRDENVAHREHAEAADLLGRVEDHGREARGHLGVEADLDARLDLVLALDEQVEQLLRRDGGLAEVGHHADERRVPLVDDLGEGRAARRHEHLPHAVLELAQRDVVDAQEGLRRALLGALVLQVPHAVLGDELLRQHADLGQDAHLARARVR
eukprot:scaffold48598_cov65-Phaeocystis_antarctica.AAC.1